MQRDTVDGNQKVLKLEVVCDHHVTTGRFAREWMTYLVGNIYT